MKRTTLVRLHILAEYTELSVAASSELVELPDTLALLNDNIGEIIRSFGFVRSQLSDTSPSRRNDGWALYTIYILETEQSIVKLVVDVRVANHPSKPNLDVKNAKRKAKLDTMIKPKLNKQNPKSIDDKVLDIYYQERNWGFQYYIGKGNEYSRPVTTIDKLDQILIGMLNKIVSKYVQE